MNYHETSIKVRFNEVDAYRVAWHGHYVAWMEIGRSALAGRFGLDAFQLAELGYLGPVVNLEIKYLRPARFNDDLTIRTRIIPGESATLVFESVVVNCNDLKLAVGLTTHALTNMEGVLQFQLPPAVAGRLDAMNLWLAES